MNHTDLDEQEALDLVDNIGIYINEELEYHLDSEEIFKEMLANHEKDGRYQDDYGVNIDVDEWLDKEYDLGEDREHIERAADIVGIDIEDIADYKLDILKGQCDWYPSCNLTDCMCDDDLQGEAWSEALEEAESRLDNRHGGAYQVLLDQALDNYEGYEWALKEILDDNIDDIRRQRIAAAIDKDRGFMSDAIDQGLDEIERYGSRQNIESRLKLDTFVPYNIPDDNDKQIDFESGPANPKKVSGKIYITDRGTEHQRKEYIRPAVIGRGDPNTLTVERNYSGDGTIIKSSGFFAGHRGLDPFNIRASMSRNEDQHGQKAIKVIFEAMSHRNGGEILNSQELEISAEDRTWIGNRPERLEAWIAKRSDQIIDKTIIADYKRRQKREEDNRRRRAEKAAAAEKAQQEAMRAQEDPAQQAERLLQ